MKKKKILIISIIAVTIAFILIILGDRCISPFVIRGTNYEDVRYSISSKLGLSPNEIQILKMKNNGELFFVLYQDIKNDRVGLSIFERSRLSKVHFSYSSGASSSREISTYNCSGMIVVFGTNTNTEAYSYSFVNSGNEYRNKIEEDYFIDVYLIDEMKDTSSNGFLYNEYGEIISQL